MQCRYPNLLPVRHPLCLSIDMPVECLSLWLPVALTICRVGLCSMQACQAVLCPAGECSL